MKIAGCHSFAAFASEWVLLAAFVSTCFYAKCREIWGTGDDVPVFSPSSRLPHLEVALIRDNPSSKLDQEMFVAMQGEVSIDDTNQSGENSVVPPGLDCFSHLP
jgi:hypothetical protein